MCRSPLRVHVGLATGLAVLMGVVAGNGARASDPFALYVVPSAVEQSAGAPARVVIHGAFFRLKSATEFLYGDPQCGVMHFQCAAGDETLCRLQWNDLAAHISTPTSTINLCAGFGSLNVISTATLRQEGAPLGTPDPWDLGMGIGEGSWVDGKCAPAQKLVCPLPNGGSGGASGHTGGASGASGGAPGRGGAPNSGGSSSGGASSGGSSSGGASSGGAGTGGAPGSGGASSSSGGATPVDGSADKGPVANQGPAARNQACAVGGDVPGGAGWGLASFGVLLALVATRARRRHRRG